MDTNDRVIVVTGAARGMGRACVDALRGAADVLIAADLVAPEVDGATGVAVDVSDPDGVAALAATVSSLGTFGGLAHAAGISPTMADPRTVFAVDLVGTRLLLDAFEPLVVPGSAAVCFASNSAYIIGAFAPDPELDAFVEDPLAEGFLDNAASRFDDSGLAYGWAKRGVIRAAAQAAITWGKRGGRVNSLSPGIIGTEMGQQELDAQPFMQTMIESSALGRIGRPDEIASVVAALLSDACSFLTGVDVLVDGGCVEGLRSAGLLPR